MQLHESPKELGEAARPEPVRAGEGAIAVMEKYCSAGNAVLIV
jgi:hypothetical protein